MHKRGHIIRSSGENKDHGSDSLRLLYCLLRFSLSHVPLLIFQLQDLGHPPKELAGEMPPGLNFDLDALNLSGPPSANGEQCLIM